MPKPSRHPLAFLLGTGLVLSLLLSAAGTDRPELPAGTILAWVPPEGSNGPPSGWLLCNRENHEKHPWVPDLTDRFLMGAANPFPGPSSEVPTDAGTIGGQRAHEHPRSRAQRSAYGSQGVDSRYGGTMLERAGHVHELDITKAEHLPPYYKVVFIVKAR
ncbi:MAG: hypothetical protein HC897_07140 [Thermoanaerobaculia bacterium]|nr:hypothetical protein [Thermoanaerobaculia bacterium]